MSNGLDVLITGIPRSGTTLVCSLLGEQTHVVAAHEPIDPFLFDGITDQRAAVALISKTLAEMRLMISERGEVITKQSGGRIPKNTVEQVRDFGLRQEFTKLGRIPIDGNESRDLYLVVKHNALFTSLLPELLDHYPVYAIVRNPLAVLLSWLTVDFPVNRGRIPMGEKFDKELTSALDNEPDLLTRQIDLLSWFFSRFRRYLDSGHVILYEEVIASQGEVLTRILDVPIQTATKLKPQYRPLDLPSGYVADICDALVSVPSVYDGFYTPGDIENLFTTEFS